MKVGSCLAVGAMSDIVLRFLASYSRQCSWSSVHRISASRATGVCSDFAVDEVVMDIFNMRQKDSLDLLRLELYQSSGVSPPPGRGRVMPQVGQNGRNLCLAQGLVRIEPVRN